MAATRDAPRLKKRFGQHHLVRPEACAPLVEFLEPASHRVLEIGPGGGILTAELLAAGARVDALELDLEWAFRLGQDLAGGRLRLAVGDAMAVDLGRWPPGTLLAGNLPYAISTAFVQAALRHHRIYPRAAFLVQREVAERLVAAPGSRDYGALSVLARARAEIRWLGRVRRGAFRPPPRVEGAFIGLTLRPPPLAEDAMQLFTQMLRQAFATRRKTLRNSLAAAWDSGRAEGALAAAGLPMSARAEELSLEEFLTLFRCARSTGSL